MLGTLTVMSEVVAVDVAQEASAFTVILFPRGRRVHSRYDANASSQTNSTLRV